MPAVAVLSAHDSQHGNELWSVDQNNQLHLLADINSGAPSSSPQALTAVGNGVVMFSANDGSTGQQLWATDGHLATRLAVINPTGDSSPADFTRVGAKIYFSADDGTHGRELWQVDASNHVSLASDLNPGAASGNPTDFAALGNLLVFAATDGSGNRDLATFDGTKAAIVPVSSTAAAGAQPSGMTSFHNAVWFSANDGTHGAELWRFDGNQASLAADINPGAGSSSPSHFAVAGGALYFDANDGGGPALFKDDGSTITKVAGTQGETVTQVTAVDQSVYFLGNDANHGTQLFSLDANGGVTQVALPTGETAVGLASANHTLYITAEESNGGQGQTSDLLTLDSHGLAKVASVAGGDFAHLTSLEATAII